MTARWLSEQTLIDASLWHFQPLTGRIETRRVRLQGEARLASQRRLRYALQRSSSVVAYAIYGASDLTAQRC